MTRPDESARTWRGTDVATGATDLGEQNYAALKAMEDRDVEEAERDANPSGNGPDLDVDAAVDALFARASADGHTPSAADRAEAMDAVTTATQRWVTEHSKTIKQRLRPRTAAPAADSAVAKARVRAAQRWDANDSVIARKRARRAPS